MNIGRINVKPLLGLAIGQWLKTRGYKLDSNMSGDTVDNSSAMNADIWAVTICEARVSRWNCEREKDAPEFMTFSAFKEWFLEPAPSWKIGCRIVTVKDGRLRIEADDITIEKKTLEEMIAALSPRP